MSDSRIEKIERFVTAPWSVTALAFILGGLGMKYPEAGGLLLILGAVFGIVAVLRHCQSLKMSGLQIISWVSLAISVALVILSYSVWSPNPYQREDTSPLGLKLTITGAAFDPLPENSTGIQLNVTVLNEGSPTATRDWKLRLTTTTGDLETFFAAGAPRSVSSPDLPRLPDLLHSPLEKNREAIGLVSFTVRREMASILQLLDDPSAALNLSVLDERNHEWTARRSLKGLKDEFIHTSTTEVTAPNPPLKIHDLFEKDFGLMAGGSTISVRNAKTNGPLINIEYKIWQDYDSKAKFISYYVPHCAEAVDVLASISNIQKGVLDKADSDVLITAKSPGDTSSTSSKDLVFTGRIYLYYEDDLTLEQLGALETLYKASGLTPQFRGRDYATTKWLGKMATPGKK